MKTFETEKHNIPEGATHYWNETLEDFFAWWDDANKLMLTPDGNGVWESVYDKSGNEPTPIPQTKPRTETEFVKIEYNHAWEAVKAFGEGEKLYTKRSHKDFVLIDNAPDVLRFLYDLHRKAEDEVDERQEFIERMLEMLDFNERYDGNTIVSDMYDNFGFRFKLVETEK